MITRLLTKLSALTLASVLVICCAATATAADNVSFSVQDIGNEVCTLFVSAPANVKVGESFELVFQWKDYVLKSGYPSAFAIEFAFDTRYIVLESPCSTCATIAEATKEWIDVCNYGGGQDLGGVEATDKSKPNMQTVNISFATAEFDDGLKNTCTVKVKFKAVYGGTADFNWIYAQFTDMSFETYIDCDMSTAELAINVEKPLDFTPEAGDVNLDGSVNSLDAATVLKSDVMLIKLNNTQQKVGDVNNDGEVDSLDAAAILKYDAGIIKKF